MSGVVWVSGASSGIGAAFVDVALARGARVIGISRRSHPHAENLPADLSDPQSWIGVERQFNEVLSTGDYDEAVFFHCAGTVAANGPLVSADPAEYTRSVLLNSASGQVLGRAFLAASSAANCPATLVMCSSPGATDALPGMSHYCGGKAGLEHWARAVAVELGDDPDAAHVFSAVPCAVDTPLLREIIDGVAADTPLAEGFKGAIAQSALATPAQVADEIWQAIDDRVAPGTALRVGATELDI